MGLGEDSIGWGGPSERAVDVDQVSDLREMRESSLDVTVEVGVENNPADAIS